MSETSENADKPSFDYDTTKYFDVTTFLKEYKKLPWLWNRKHRLFTDRESRLMAEKVLGEKLGIQNPLDMKKKIRCIRGIYNQEIRKIKLSLEHDDEVYLPRRPWFHLADSFLRGTTNLSPDVVFQINPDEINRPKRVLLKCQKKPSRSKMRVQSHYIQVDDDNVKYESEESLDALYAEELNNDTDTAMLDVFSPDNGTEQPIEIDKHNNTINDGIRNDHTDYFETLHSENSEDYVSPDYKKRRTSNSFKIDKKTNSFIIDKKANSFKTDKNVNLSQIDKNVNSSLPVCLGKLVENADDEFLAFGRSIGMQLQKFPTEMALQLQLDIQTHITKARLDYLSKNRKP